MKRMVPARTEHAGAAKTAPFACCLIHLGLNWYLPQCFIGVFKAWVENAGVGIRRLQDLGLTV